MLPSPDYTTVVRFSCSTQYCTQVRGSPRTARPAWSTWQRVQGGAVLTARLQCTVLVYSGGYSDKDTNIVPRNHGGRRGNTILPPCTIIRFTAPAPSHHQRPFARHPASGASQGQEGSGPRDNGAPARLRRALGPEVPPALPEHPCRVWRSITCGNPGTKQGDGEGARTGPCSARS